MSVLLPKPPISRRRKMMALAVAGAADLLQVVLFPLFIGGAITPPDDVLDFLVAVALVVIVGFKWQLVLGLALELVPVMALFPTWTAVVLALPSESGGAVPPCEVTVTTVTRQPPRVPPVQVPPPQIEGVIDVEPVEPLERK